jgi:hypothetical protein
MTKSTPGLAWLFIVVAVYGCAKEEPVNLPSSLWPPLSGQKCISGRAATAADVDAGNAVFVLQAEGQPIGKPLGIKIPQYAFHLEEGTGRRTPCVIIQAEEARGQRMIGCRMLYKGELLAATLAEFELLGEKPAAQKK